MDEDVSLSLSIYKAIMRAVQVCVRDELPNAAYIIRINLGLRLVHRTCLEVRHHPEWINEELDLVWGEKAV